MEAMQFVVLSGRLLVADIAQRNGRFVTADLYLNLDEFRRGRAIDRQVKLQF